jgi:hypothetical protein
MDFLKDVNNWDNHRPFLFWALEQTKNSQKPIVEFGCGVGSTPYLQDYSKKNSRQLISYDFNLEWASKYDAIHVTDWDSIIHEEYSVALIDHSPADRRYKDIAIVKDKCDYIIIHDTEPEATGYLYNLIWELFPYRRDLETTTNNHTICATIVSTKFFIPEINFTCKINSNPHPNILTSIDYEL